jgi:hypothetical protein
VLCVRVGVGHAGFDGQIGAPIGIEVRRCCSGDDRIEDVLGEGGAPVIIGGHVASKNRPSRTIIYVEIRPPSMAINPRGEHPR